VADVSDLFGRIVSEVSEIGIQVAHCEWQHLQQQQRQQGDNTNHGNNNSEELNMKIDRQRASKGSDENRAFSTLLQFWSASISYTALLPVVVSVAGAKRGNNKGSDEGEVPLRFYLFTMFRAVVFCFYFFPCSLLYFSQLLLLNFESTRSAGTHWTVFSHRCAETLTLSA
jgi:hypothetical protein